MRVLLMDNFDSFTHNLAQALGALGACVSVRRHDAPVEGLLAERPERVVISPGPGGPAETGTCAELLIALDPGIPVLGVCLGMQLIAAQAGAKVGRAPQPVHGKASLIRHDGRGVFHGLPATLHAARYHSLAVDAATLPEGLVPTAWAEDGVLMGLRHERRPLEGIQFHPESVLTRMGPVILANFLRPREMRPEWAVLTR